MTVNRSIIGGATLASADHETDVAPQQLRAVMGRFCTGVAVITGMDERGPAGMLVQSLVSVSLEPPLVLFCPKKTSGSWSRIADSGSFGVNILSDQQLDLCNVFAKPGVDKFGRVEWYPARSGLPVLARHLAYIDCRIETVHGGGDHDIVVGRVTELNASDLDDPLLFYRGQFGRWAA